MVVMAQSSKVKRAPEEFIIWLKNEMDKRSWSQADLARNAGVAEATISRILAVGDRKPGAEVCNALAIAFGESPEKVHKLAGLLPNENTDKPEGLTDYEKELVGWVRELPESRRETILEIVKGLVSRRARKRNQQS